MPRGFQLGNVLEACVTIDITRAAQVITSLYMPHFFTTRHAQIQDSPQYIPYITANGEQPGILGRTKYISISNAPTAALHAAEKNVVFFCAVESSR